MSQKDKVLGFIDKVQDKAIKSVSSRHKTAIDECKTKLLSNDPQMQELMQKAEHLTFEATEVLRLIKGKIPHMSLTDYGNPFRHMWKLDDLSVLHV
jgi:hypothetical protein